MEYPPLRATRRLRWGAGIAGSAIYVALWLAGLGHHDALLLTVAPLPLLLALSLRYAGAMNAAGRLSTEGVISVAESLLIAALAIGMGLIGGDWLLAALIGLVAGRAAGTMARAIVVRRLPLSDAELPAGVLRRQLEFVPTTSGAVVQGGIDVLVLGIAGTFETVGVSGPLFRIAYTAVLVADGLTWALYARAERPNQEREPGVIGALIERWRLAGIILGITAGLTFAVIAAPAVRIILGHDVDVPMSAVILQSTFIALRFASFVQNVDLITSGMQGRRFPVFMAPAAVVGIGALAGSLNDSLVQLAAARVAGDVVLVAGYAWILAHGSVQSRTGRPVTIADIEPGQD